METIPPPATAPIFRFGTFELNLKTGELRKRGLRLPLQDQPLRVLVALLEQPGVIVGREALCRRLWPEGTFVDFEHSLNAAVRRLRVALGDEADAPRFIETVHKRGYRFLGWDPSGRSAAHFNHAGSPATIAHIARTRTRLAVLPFGPADGFADGLTEEAITQLAQTCPRTIGVIARTSVARVQRDGRGAAEVARALDADYLVEGSVRRDGERLRITAQLIESQEETHVWADTYDREMTSTLAVQTDVAGAIARSVSAALATVAAPFEPR